ncbi:MAG TPA: hypothetical protein VG965_02450 [Patescibacteria group bacterium]|nr:hypothetical protein [Patescibacteria group bacterium]
MMSNLKHGTVTWISRETGIVKLDFTLESLCFDPKLGKLFGSGENGLAWTEMSVGPPDTDEKLVLEVEGRKVIRWGFESQYREAAR